MGTEIGANGETVPPGGPGTGPWHFVRFGLIVTGRGEREFLPRMFRSLMAGGSCVFEVVRRIEQRSPITSPRRRLKMVGTGKTIPDRDAEQIGLPARRYLSQPDRFVVLVDDLEHGRRTQARDVFRRYRQALDTMLHAERRRASVHFFVNMLEAYYFANAETVNAVLGTELTDYGGDVETIPHPKNDLKSISTGFDEIEHGKEIMGKLDMEHVLSRPDTCASLRALFAWCVAAMGQQVTERYELDRGAYSVVTGPQIADLQDAGPKETIP